MALARVLRYSRRLYAALQHHCASSLAAQDAPRPIRTLSSIFAARPAAPHPQPITRAAQQKKRPTRPPLSDPLRYWPIVEKSFPEELPAEAERLMRRLHEEGYLRNANLYRESEFDPQNVHANSYSRNFLKCAAESLGHKHQEIAKWLSGSELKKVALFGCPSVERKAVFSAKRLRAFFKIHENIVCRGCLLKSSCKFVNKEVGRVENVVLADVMRLLLSYALDSVPQPLSVPNDLKLSISKVLKEVVNLGE